MILAPLPSLQKGSMKDGHPSRPPGSDQSASSSDIKTCGRRVLLVDDDDDVRETLAEILAMRGFVVAKAVDGHEALKCATDASPDIAILDVGLPGMDGYELARRLRFIAGIRAALLLIAVTGYGQQENRRLAHEAGFKHHLVKPFDLDVLARALDDQVTAEF